MERALRQLQGARAVFKRAYSRRYDAAGGQLALAYEWLRFEREEGRCVTLRDAPHTSAHICTRVCCFKGEGEIWLCAGHP
jgi:hypothetical protein